MDYLKKFLKENFSKYEEKTAQSNPKVRFICVPIKDFDLNWMGLLNVVQTKKGYKLVRKDIKTLWGNKDE